MDSEVQQITSNLLDESRQLETLNDILELLEKRGELSSEFWNSDELIIVLIQYITDSYNYLGTPLFIKEEINKVKICLDILTVISKNHSIKDHVLKLQLDFYIYPFLMPKIDETRDEGLKMSALSFFHSLLKDGLPEKIKSCELLPLLLKIIDSESDQCQILALGTLSHILNGYGLDYAVQTLDRFQAIDVVLGSLLKKSINGHNSTILKILLNIYIRLCEKPNVKLKLKDRIPEDLSNKEVIVLAKQDKEIGDLVGKLIGNLTL